MVGHEGGVVPVPPDNMQQVKLYVTLDKKAALALPAAASAFEFVITDIANGAETEHGATFQGPPR